jgi:spore maturation protein SpmA
MGVINLRLAAKSADPYSIVVPTLCATGVAFVVSLVLVKAFARLPRYRRQYDQAPDKPAAAAVVPPPAN